MYEIPILFYCFQVGHCTAIGCTKDKSSLLCKKITFLALVRISECSTQSNMAMEHYEILMRAKKVKFTPGQYSVRGPENRVGFE